MKKIIGLIVVIALVILFYRSWDKSENLSLQTPPVNSNSGTIAQAESFPFQEMTIPYLRNREYKSKLGEIKPVSNSTSFSTFLTSYDSDNLKINALLTKPNGDIPAGGWPAVVFVHGYIPPSLYKTQERYTDYINYLSRNGFVVLKIDLRGHGESEGEAGGGYFSSDYIVDTLNAYSALQNSDFVNPKRIGLWGHSMAGNVLLRSMVVKKDIPAVVVWAGAVYTYLDQREYGINDNSYRPPTGDTQRIRKRQQLRDMYGDASAESDFWKQVIPTNYLTDVTGAIQLHHAVDDDVVSVEYSRNLKQILDNTSTVHQVFEYPTGGHNLSGVSFGTAMQRTVEFYKAQLK